MHKKKGEVMLKSRRTLTLLFSTLRTFASRAGGPRIPIQGWTLRAHAISRPACQRTIQQGRQAKHVSSDYWRTGHALPGYASVNTKRRLAEKVSFEAGQLEHLLELGTSNQ